MEDFTSTRTDVFTFSFRISHTKTHTEIFFIGVNVPILHEALNKINTSISDVLLDKEAAGA